MYSDMSRRTIALSSSNRNSASARAVSVFPTPVGPRKMKDPMGRFGSERPARARRTAAETASTASRCPMTRSASRSSICSSFWTSPSISLETGMPVHLDTTSAISSGLTSSLSMEPAACSSASCFSAAVTFCSTWGSFPNFISAARLKSASRSARACSFFGPRPARAPRSARG